jgi:hypothetical protein
MMGIRKCRSQFHQFSQEKKIGSEGISDSGFTSFPAGVEKILLSSEPGKNRSVVVAA